MSSRQQASHAASGSSSNSFSSILPPIGFVKNPASSSNHASSASQQYHHCSSRDRHAIHVLFLQPLPNDPHEHFLNRLTSYIGAKVHKKGFHHTEIVIPDLEDDPKGFLSSSIYNGETVTLTKTKTFANPGYTVMSFTVTGKELAGISNYLHDSRRMQLSFDGLGMYLAALPFQVGFRGSRSTFCSKHVTKALKAGGIEAVQDLNENIVTPSKLYRVLYDKIPSDRKVAGTVAYKEQTMAQSGRLPLFSIS